MIDALRPFLSRIIAPVVTAFLAYLTLRFGLNFGADAAGHITETAVIVLVAGMQLAYGLIHRFTDKKVNPVDAASAPLAVAGKVESEKGGP